MDNTIRQRRKERGISQEELAVKCGVSRQTVNAIENNKYDPTLTLAFHLAQELCMCIFCYRKKQGERHGTGNLRHAVLCGNIPFW